MRRAPHHSHALPCSQIGSYSTMRRHNKVSISLGLHGRKQQRMPVLSISHPSSGEVSTQSMHPHLTSPHLSLFSPILFHTVMSGPHDWPITHSNGKRYAEKYLLFILHHHHRHHRHHSSHPQHQATTPTPSQQHLNTLHPTLNNTLKMFHGTSNISQPCTTLSINYNNPNISKFILFISIFIVVCKSSNVHTAWLHGAALGLVRPTLHGDDDDDDGLRRPRQHLVLPRSMYPLRSFFFFIPRLFASSLVM